MQTIACGLVIQKLCSGSGESVPATCIVLVIAVLPLPRFVLSGKVNSRREAVVRLWIRGPSGRTLETEAIVDTGFTGSLTLPQSHVTRLGLTWKGRGEGVLADGTNNSFQVYEAVTLWHSQPRVISVHAVEADPLLGMALLDGSELAMQVVEGGEVVIHELPVS